MIYVLKDEVALSSYTFSLVKPIYVFFQLIVIAQIWKCYFSADFFPCCSEFSLKGLSKIIVN